MRKNAANYLVNESWVAEVEKYLHPSEVVVTVRTIAAIKAASSIVIPSTGIG